MIERKFVSQNIREFLVKEFLFKELSRVGLSDVRLQRTPLGEKIVVVASRPGLVVGKGGSNISRLTRELKNKFNLENPQIEIEEVTDPRGNAAVTAEMIANSLEKFGTARFKGVGHKALGSAMESGALGIEVLISGKIPSSRAKTWRFYNGYLKKCGDVSISGVNEAIQIAKTKTGVVGVQVRIMPGTTVLPDKVKVIDVAKQAQEQAQEAAKENKETPEAEQESQSKNKEAKKEKKAETKEDTKEEKKTAKKKSTKKTTKKASTKKETKDEE